MSNMLPSKRWLKPFMSLFIVMSVVLPHQAYASKPLDDKSIYKGLKFRSIGPHRGGRSAAVTGVPGKTNLYYMGAAGGGVWRTEDAGNIWQNISDGYFGGSIGAIAVAPSDHNVLYVGGGEVTVRGNVSHGDGVWKSTDKGKTWKHMGLSDSRRIPRMVVHPTDPDTVYAAVLGHLYGPNEERGVYRSKDGGESWEKILFVNDEVGAVDLAMDPTNPRVMFASTWRVKRTPYSMDSGGEGSGFWKSVDGGSTWTNITENEGMPQGPIGIIGVTVSPVNPERVWAQVEAPDGGLLRSEDGGETWKMINQDNALRQRAWYYSRLYADTKSVDTVYALNVRFHRSTDGGKTFSTMPTPHGDHHDLWISPEDPNRMVLGDDGGAQISFNAGQSWTTYHNQPTAQFYRVTTDNHFPYRIYGAQQDNSTIRINHRSDSGSLSLRDWEPTAGGESGHIAPHPTNPDIVFGGSYLGFLNRLDHSTNKSRTINVWPDFTLGAGAEAAKYRFQWNFPILFSPHDDNTLYAAANVLFRSTDQGQSWQEMSPDLTRNDPEKLVSSGGPITQDNTSVEYYATIFAVAESEKEKGVIWTGSDDGLLHITRDNGENWKNVTPNKLPTWTQINSIEVDPFNAGGLFVAATSYKSDDFTPYLFHTTNYGKSWKRIDKGIARNHFTRVVRADPKREGLLFAGTEAGLYMSLDNGKNWSTLRLNLPVVPITDLAIKENDLIVATQGRSFWVLDDLTPLHVFDTEKASQESYLVAPRDSYRLDTSGRGAPGPAGENLPNGVLVHFHLAEDPLLKDTPKHQKEGKQAVQLEFLDAQDNVLKSFTTDNEESTSRFSAEKGFNRFVWNMRTEPPRGFDGMILWTRSLRGYKVKPGQYKVRMTMGDQVQTEAFAILSDPRTDATTQDFELQHAFLSKISKKLDDTHLAIQRIRTIRAEVEKLNKKVAKMDEYESLVEQGKGILEKIQAIEEVLYQTKLKSEQDPLGKPIRLNDKLNTVFGMSAGGDKRPTDQALAYYDEAVAKIDEQLNAFDTVLKQDIEAYNNAVIEQKVPLILLKDE
jgi:photosystem II stability/assembly factor-like uncharacterized protein